MSLAPTLVVNQPPDNLVVQPNQPFLVTGRASDRARPEPIFIDSVTVKVDDQPPVEATLTHLPPRTSTVFAYKASAQVTGGHDPHTVAVTATNDQNRSTTKTLLVFTGPVFKIAAPAVIIDISPFLSDPNDPKILEWLSKMQQQLRPLAALVTSAAKMLAGPNLFLTTNDQGIPVLRLGIWIEDPDFPVLAPSPLFPLPRLSEEAAAAGFNTVPLLPVPAQKGLAPAFAISVPTTTLQGMLDAVAPAAREAASQAGATLKSLTATTSPPATVLTTASGDLPLAFPLTGAAPFSITIAEMLGTEQQPDPVQPDVMHSVPAIIGTSHWSSAGGWAWFWGLFNPLIFLTLYYASTQVSDASDQASQQVNGVVGPLLASIPPSIPFQNTALPFMLVGLDFPALVLDWESFGVTESGILGTGTTSLKERDESRVGTGIRGLRDLKGYQEEFAGGAGQGYGFKLVNIAPDPGKFTWQMSGTASDQGLIDIGPFTQSGSFGVDFPLALDVKIGTYAFTLEMHATETCGSDASKTLSASASIHVKVEVLPNPKVPK